jgi:hypothetical protein
MIAVLLAAGLAIALLLLWWFRPVEDTPPVTEAAPATTTTTTTTLATTTTTLSTTTTTTDAGSHVVETVEEAEEILAFHYYRWFTGIHDEDEELIRSLVILDSQAEAAVNQFGSMEFTGAPSLDGFEFVDTEILQSDAGCLAIWSLSSADFRPGSSEGVTIFRWHDSQWKFLSSWRFREDLWEADCDSLLP